MADPEEALAVLTPATSGWYGWRGAGQWPRKCRSSAAASKPHAVTDGALPQAKKGRQAGGQRDPLDHARQRRGHIGRRDELAQGYQQPFAGQRTADDGRAEQCRAQQRPAHRQTPRRGDRQCKSPARRQAAVRRVRASRSALVPAEYAPAEGLEQQLRRQRQPNRAASRQRQRQAQRCCRNRLIRQGVR